MPCLKRAMRGAPYALLCLLSAAAPPAASTSALPPGDPALLQAQLSQAISRGSPFLAIAPALYNFSGASLIISNAASLTVDLRGSELTFSPASDAGIRIANASNLTLVGPVIDSAPFFSSQGVVSAGVRDGKWFNYTFAVEAGFPPPVLGGRTVFWHAENRTMVHAQVETTTTAMSLAETSPGVYAVATSFFGNPTLTVPLPCLGSITPVHADLVTCVNCSAVRYLDWAVYGSAGMAFLEIAGDGGNVYENVSVVRRPGTTRLLASSIDVLHSTGMAAGPALLDSELSAAGDDLFAVHCELGILWWRAADATAYVIDTAGAGTEALRGNVAGAELQFYALNTTMEGLASATVRSAVAVTDPALLAAAAGAQAHIEQTLHTPIRDFPVSLFRVDFAAPLPPYLGNFSAMVQNNRRCGAGARVERSYLHDTTGGMRLKAAGVSVVNSTVRNAYGMRMLPELFWTQSMSANVSLRNNVLTGCGCAPHVPHAIEFLPGEVPGLELVNNSVLPPECF